MARPSSRPSSRRRGYDTAWDKARAGFLASHPFCRACADEGRRTAATVVDHIRPHRGDRALFWDRANWQPLCAEHHSRDKQQLETRGYATRVGCDGLPTDPSHPFYAGAAPKSGDSPSKGGGVKSPGRKGAGPHGYRPAELVSVIVAAIGITVLHFGATLWA